MALRLSESSGPDVIRTQVFTDVWKRVVSVVHFDYKWD